MGKRSYVNVMTGSRKDVQLYLINFEVELISRLDMTFLCEIRDWRGVIKFLKIIRVKIMGLCMKIVFKLAIFY
jgi:hypothetical protein